MKKRESLTEIERWKATKFRQFSVVLKEIVVDVLYFNFLLFHVGSTILVSDSIWQDHSDVAEN